MFESLIVTLREGVEAALMVGIIVAFLRKEGSERYLGAVWAGIATATAASLLGAFFLYRAAVNEEVFEGLLYIASAVLVGTLLIWMWRHSHALSGQVKGSLGRILAREAEGGAKAVLLGLFLFTFLMIFREGIETILFLSALSLTTTGLLSFLGAILGLAAAVVFGVLFVRGSVRIDLGRFFKITDWKQPADRAMFGDCLPGPTMSVNPPAISGGSTTLDPRHGGHGEKQGRYVNITYWDGSASSVLIKEARYSCRMQYP